MNQTRCIVKRETFNTEDLKQLSDIQKHFGWDDATLEAKIGTWQTIHNTDELPSIEDMKFYESTLLDVREKIKKLPFFKRYQNLKKFLNDLKSLGYIDNNFYVEIRASKISDRNKIRRELQELGKKYDLNISIQDAYKGQADGRVDIYGLQDLLINGITPENLYKQYEIRYQQLWSEFNRTSNITDYITSLSDDDILSNKALFEQDLYDAYIFTEQEYKDFLEEMELNKDNTDLFLYNFVHNVLRVVPRSKVKNLKPTLQNFPSPETMNVPIDKQKVLLKKILGIDKFDISDENLIDKLRDYLKNNWENDLYEALKFAKESSDEEKLSIRRKLFNINKKIKLLEEYIANPSIASVESIEYAESLTRGKSTIKQRASYEIKRLKSEEINTEYQLRLLNIRAKAKILGLKNRLMVLYTIENLDELILERVKLEQESYKYQDWNRDFSEYVSLFKKIQEILGKTKELNTLNPIFEDASEVIIENTGDQFKTMSFSKLCNKLIKKHPENKTLLELVQQANPKVKIKILSKEEYLKNYQNLTGEQASHYYPKDNTLYLREDVTDDILLHEILHSASTYIMLATQEDNKDSFENKVLAPFVEYVNNYLRQHVGEYGPYKIFGVPVPATIYGLTNPREFLAEVFSNEDFQEILSMIPPMNNKEYKSLLHQFTSEIIDFIKDFLKIKSSKTALDQAKELGIGIIRTQSTVIDELYEQLLNINEIQPTILKVNTHQESTLPNPTLEQQMKQEWTPQVIQFRANTITRIFKSIVDDLENELPEIEQLSTSSATRKYIMTARYGTGNILQRVRQEIADTYANLDWVTEYVHELFDENDWTSKACQDKIAYIYQQGQKMLQYFEPLCLEASSDIKLLEGISILTNDGEVVDLSETELLTDEEIQSKHEEGWFYNPHEQSIEETLESETVNLLSSLYETDADGNYTRFDDLEQPISLDFRMVLATTAKVIGSCTIDAQMLPKLRQEAANYPWMDQIINMLMGIDTDGSRIYEGLSDEDIRLKALSLRAIVWKDLHKIYVNIAEQTRTEDEAESNEKSTITSKIVNKREGADALMKQFEDICYNNKTLFDNNHKPYKAVYNSDGTFNENNYNTIHQEILSSKLYYDIQAGTVSEEEINLIDRALKSFGINISIDNIRKLFAPTDNTVTQQEKINKLRDVIFGFYAANPATNRPLQSVKSNTERANIFDAFRSNYTTISEIFDDESIGFEESTGRVTVDGERKSLFSRILPNPIHTIVNKLKNNDGISEANYQARLQRDYGHNWWFAPKTDSNGNGIFRSGLLKDLVEIPATRIGLRIKSLKSSMGLSQSQEIDAQAEETRLNEFENTTRDINGIKFRDYSVPTFSDKGESYFMSMRYFNIKDVTQRQELVNRLCDVIRQEIDRINVVEERARVNADAIKNGLEPPIKPIACWDIEFNDEGNRVDDRKSGAYFHFFSILNDSKDSFLKQYQEASDNPVAQQQLLERAVNWAMQQEFNFYLAQYNEWQVNQLPKSQHNENKNNESRKQLVNWIKESAKNLPLDTTQRTIIGSIVNRLENDTLTDETLRELTNTISNIFSSVSNNQQWTAAAQNYLSSVKFDTTNLDKLEDYFWNSFYANTQIIGITMRDPAFLGTPDKFQKRYAMFYSPVQTCYTIEYDLAKYRETGEFVVLDPNSSNSLVRTTEYSLTLKDDVLSEVFSIDNVKAAIEKRVVDGYLTKDQAKEIIDNLKGVVRSDAQCYRTLPSWQACLNMIGKGYNKKMQQSINRLMNPEQYGQWSYEDYHNVWEIFKPFVASYNQVTSGLNSENSQFNEQFSQVEMPTMHKNSEFLLLAMYNQLSGVMKDNWKLKAINEFMVKHGIDKVQFESAVKTGNQAPVDLNNCTTPEEVIATLEGTTGLHNDMQASEGNQQVIHSIPFRDWGISTSMPEHLLEHEESSMGTQLMKIIMEGLSENPSKIVKVNGVEKTYSQWLQLYQAIEVQNLKDAFAEVGKTFASDAELAKYLRKQILTQNKYSHELIDHLELDGNGVFKYPITDPLLRSQFDALCASLIRNSITKRMMRMGALPQVASYGFDNLQLRFNDRYGNLILTEEEFNTKKEKSDKKIVTIKAENNTLEFNTWEDYQKYAKANCTTIAYMEVYLPPFDITLAKKVNDMCIYKEDVYEDGKLVHRSGEFNEELFNVIFDKKLLEGLANRVPTETKHSMIPIRVKGFLPAQNSSCAVCPAEWIAISDSDNDGDKLYTYFYHSKAVWDTDLMKQDWAEHYDWNYISKTERDRLLEENQKFAKGTRISSSDRTKFESEDYKKSEELDIMWDAMLADKSVDKALEEFYKQAQNNPARYFRIKPVKFKKENIERIKGESDRDYQQRIDLASIASNSHEARNNMMLDLMRSILQTDDNTAQILIPGGFPIAKKVAKQMKKLMGIKDDICSICNPAIRTIQQIRNMAGKNLIGIYANHRSLRPLLEQAKCTLHPDNRPTINSNKSLPKRDGRLTWSLSAEKNSKGEFISDNISNFSGASVDNAKDPLLSYLGQNEVTAPIAMTLIHLGYTIEEMASFMNQPAIKECVRAYMLNGRKGFLENIVEAKIAELKEASTNATEDRTALEQLPLDILQNAITRDSQHILPNDNDNLLQLIVLENFSKILPASRAIQSIISVTKADTQVGALTARSSDNKVKLQTINRLIDRVKKSDYPIQGAEALVPDINSEKDIDNAIIPHIAAFRYYGIESIIKFMGDISMTFNKLVDTVHNIAVNLTDALSLNSETIENLTNATTSYIFSGIEEFNKDRGDVVIEAVSTLNEIKQRNLIDGNPLIKDLIANMRGNAYSKNYPFIRLSKGKSVRDNNTYKRAWESLIINGSTEIKLKDRTITYQELSDMLLRYCFAANGLNIGGSSFIQCFPDSQINTIKGYVDQLSKKLASSDSTALRIIDQYVANHPEDYHFVHKIGAKTIKPFLENSKVIPNTIIVSNLSAWSDLWQEVYDPIIKQDLPVAYPYIFFKDKSGRRYLYKGDTSTPGMVSYQRMQVLGNAENGFMEEYEQGKEAIFGRNNSIQSALGNINSRVVLDAAVQNKIDTMKQEAAKEGRTLTATDYRETIEGMLGSNVQVFVDLNDYKSQNEDLTGMEFCVTI